MRSKAKHTAKKVVLLLFIMFFILFVPALSEIEPFQRLLWGSSRTCYPTEEFLYVGAGGAILTCEISNAQNIEVINQFYLPTMVQDIIVNAGILYALDFKKGLFVFNVADPLSPVQISAIDFNLYSFTLTLDSIYLFISHGSLGITKVDISNPASPFSVDFSNRPCSDLTTYGGYLYSRYNNGNNESYITIIDPVTLDSLNSFAVCQSYPSNESLELQFYNNYAFLIENYFGIRDPWSELAALDMSDPLNPQRIITFTIGNYGNAADGFISRNDTVIVSFSDDFYVFDFSDIENPVLISQNSDVLERHSQVEYLKQFGTYFFAGYDYAAGINLVEFTDSSTLNLLDYLDTSCHTKDILVEDSLLIVGKSGYEGIFFIDISDIMNPQFNQIYPEQLGYTEALLREDNFLYAGDDTGFSTYQLIGGDSLTFLGRLELGQFQYSKTIDKKDSIVFLGSHSNGVQMIDVTDPAVPTLFNVIDTGGYIHDLFIRNNRLLICGYSMPTMIWDVSDVTNPSLLLGDFNSGLYGEFLYPSEDGSILFLADNRELAIVDITNLEQIDTLSTINISWGYYISEIFVEENRLLFSAYTPAPYSESVIYVFDLSDMTSPQFIDSLCTAGFARFIVSNSDYIFISDSYDGIYVIEKDQLTLIKSEKPPLMPDMSYKITDVYPNPFNSAVNIQFSLTFPGDIDLILFNILGQTVTIIEQGRFLEGDHRIVWNSDNYSEIASGVYFVGLRRQGHLLDSRKIILLK